ncbi:NitT/TauT family transport system substrate-binding protein [Arthrobacter subterraneus]|uniref:NitT/TauT family transport system substrate-binding protein n=1 Tax=Arthrobacter subterraneus TaxID=335973 RepID=A0A1G8CVW2_9MICC|nr:ABC transporter substrate-binding protein [Arthrobacter subterraneus]SDH49641.1 NitT/TauT family transport system substrate-binding protein [Arthrobacter subterraneus]
MTYDPNTATNENLIRPATRGILLKSRTAEGFIAGAAIVAVATGAAIAAYASSQSSPQTTTAAAPVSDAEQLRLGYFGNLTHAPALVGLENGYFAEELGDTELATQVFNAGPSAIEALNAGAIDATFIGPNPAINSYVQSKGESLRIVAGATAGGAQLVVNPGVESIEDLAGKTLATPQLGNTQDVALRVWLGEQGYETTIDGGGDVAIVPTENATTLQLFRNGDIDGAWLPEPWASRLVVDAGAEVLVDEADLWPEGKFATTVLVVNKQFLAEHPDQVEALLRGELRAIEWLNENPQETPALINAGLTAADAKPLAEAVLERALENVTFSQDPLAGALAQLLADGVAAGTTSDADITGILHLDPLNSLQEESGGPVYDDAGLGSGTTSP